MSANSGRATPVTVSAVVSGTPAIYIGFSLRETAGATAVVRVYDNATTAAGTILDTIALAPSESAREYYVQGLYAEKGLYVQVVSGTVEGSIRTR